MINNLPPHLVGRLETLPERISDLVWGWEKKTPNAPAIVEDDLCWSYADLAAAVREAREFLLAQGIRPGDRVMVVNETGRAVTALLLAASMLDAWSVIVNARLSGPEIDAIVEHAGVRRILFTTEISAEATAHAQRHKADFLQNPWLGGIATGPLNKAAEAEPVFAEGIHQIAALIYTSGTTGTPKGVMLTHRNLLFIAAISGGMRGFVAEDVIYGVLPLSHAYGLASVFLGGLYAGSCFMPRARFDAAQTWRDIEGGMTALQGVPAMYAKLLAYMRQSGLKLGAHKLRFTSAGGSPLDAAIKRASEDVFGQPLHNGYGMTEASPSMAMTRIDAPRQDCSVGQALPFVELIVVDQDGKELMQGETGDVWCRGPGIMKGYYRDPALTAKTLTPDGWLITGDVGHFDRDNSLHISGRSKELIIRSGFNIYPPEVEGVLNAHPQVIQAAVVGAPGVDGNEDVIAFLQIAPDNSPTIGDLEQFCAARLAPYKRPAKYVLRESLPAGATGKILKHKLRAEIS